MEDVFAFAEEHHDEQATQSKPWKVLIVDDEPEIHNVTRMALGTFKFRGRGLDIMSAYTGAEAINMLRAHPDTAVVFMDVVMESDNSGLEAVRRIRDELKNMFVRIILRTGQPGQNPENDVIVNYDINDYKAKTELTVTKLFSAVITALRAYDDLVMLENNRKGLETVVHAFASAFEVKSFETFVRGVLNQMISMLRLENNAIFTSTFAPQIELAQSKILAATGIFEPYVGKHVIQAIGEPGEKMLRKAIASKQNIYDEDCVVVIHNGEHSQRSLLYLENTLPGLGNLLGDKDRALLEEFVVNASIAYSNLANLRKTEV